MQLAQGHTTAKRLSQNPNSGLPNFKAHTSSVKSAFPIMWVGQRSLMEHNNGFKCTDKLSKVLIVIAWFYYI